MSSFRPGRYREPPIWSRINTPKLVLHWMIYTVYYTVHIIQCILYSALQVVQCTSPDVTALLTEQCQTSLKCYKKAKAGASMQNMASNAQRFRNQIVLFHRIVQCLTGRMCDVKYKLLHTEG